MTRELLRGQIALMKGMAMIIKRFEDGSIESLALIDELETLQQSHEEFIVNMAASIIEKPL